MNLEILRSMTLDEVETIEQIVGRAFDDLLADGQLKGKALKAVVWIHEKKSNPAFTIEDAGKFTFEQCVELLSKTTGPKA